ncbi:hypothetical protein BC832DRAFT_593834 [Gaertneriomyces semiglobifer]|nr:hypothetical protein BC832DRAFT_593834 [Gaertneriomyces semiglobifer]
MGQVSSLDLDVGVNVDLHARKQPESQRRFSTVSRTSTSSAVSNSSTVLNDMQYLGDVACAGSASMGSLESLPLDLLLHLCTFISPHTLHILLQTSKWLYTTITEHLPHLYRSYTIARFALPLPHVHQHRLSFDPSENCWSQMYCRLSNLRTRWIGWALDRGTNGFRVYPMEIVIKSSWTEDWGSWSSGPKTRFDGICRWKCVGDAMTRVSGTSSMPNSRDMRDLYAARQMTFREHALLRPPAINDNGGNGPTANQQAPLIALPNVYTAVLHNSFIVGSYDPGSTAEMRGVFGLVMEECLLPAPQEGVSHVLARLGLKVRRLYEGWFCGVRDASKFIDHRFSLMLSSYNDEKSNHDEVFGTLTYANDTFNVRLQDGSPPTLRADLTHSDAEATWAPLELYRTGSVVFGFAKEPDLRVWCFRL